MSKQNKCELYSILRKYASESQVDEVEQQPKSSISYDYNGKIPVVRIYDTIINGDDDVFEQVVKTFLYDETGEDTGIQELEIDINTYGGSLEASLGIVSQIQELQAKGIKVTGIVKGKAFSGGCIILLACDERIARKHSTLLYHPPLLAPNTSDGYLTVTDLKELLKSLSDSWSIMKDQLKERTKLTDKEINKIYNQCLDYTLNVDEAIEKGFIHKVL